MNKNIVIIGASGHAKVIADIIEKSGDKIVGFLDDDIDKQEKIVIKNIKVIGKISEIDNIILKNNTYEFIIGIGNNNIRMKIAEKYEHKIKFYTAIHPSANIGLDVSVGEGTVIMPNASINSCARIGKHCVINTGAIVEHDNNIEDYVHISPNATLCGAVNVGKMTHIGAGATVKNNIDITQKCVIGAGAVVVKNIEEQGQYVGVPARYIKEEGQ